MRHYVSYRQLRYRSVTVLKEKRVEKAQDTITNRVLIFFGCTAVFLWAISYLSSAFDYQVSYYAARIAAVVLIFVGAAGVVAGFVWQGARVRSGKAQNAAFSGYTIAWFSLVLALSSAMMRFYSYTLAMRLLYVLMPVAAILYLVYYTYPRAFFTVCTTHVSLAFLMWTLAKASGVSGSARIRCIAFALAALLCLVMLCLVWATRKTGGAIRLGRRSVAVFGKKTGTRYLAGLYTATLILFAAALFLGAPFAFYALYALAGFIFVAAVYYTVRML